MTPQMEALAMLNAKFNSLNGVPVESVRINRSEYKQLFEALALPSRPEEVLTVTEIANKYGVSGTVGDAIFYWKEEARRHSENADYWRKKVEELTGSAEY